MKSSRILLSVVGAISLSAGTSQAAVYYLQANIGNTDWVTNTSIWWDQTSGGGNHPATVAGNDYDLNGFTLIATNGTNTFPGTSLKLNGGGVRFRATTTIPVATGTGGSVLLSQDAGTGGRTFSITNFTNSSGTTIFRVDDGGTSSLTANIGTITGAGNIAIDTTSATASVKTVLLTATTATNWTGNLTWLDADNLNLQFGADTVFGGGLVAPSTARITLDKNLTFASVSLGGTPLSPGTYDFNYLNANFDAIFNNGGSGSITVGSVVPEPSMAALALTALPLLGTRRRK